MRHLAAWLDNGYCSIIVVNHRLFTVIRFVARSYTHLWRGFANRFYLILHACKIFFVAQVVLGKQNRTTRRSIQGPLGNLKNPDMQGLFWFFLRSDASGIGAAVIYRMHALGVKAHAESNQIRNKRWLFFSQEKLMTRVLSLVFEPSKNRPCIVGWREYMSKMVQMMKMLHAWDKIVQGLLLLKYKHSTLRFITHC